MCFSSKAPKAVPAPASAAPVSSTMPLFNMEDYENESDVEAMEKGRMGKKALRIKRPNFVVGGGGSGLQIPMK